MLYFDGVVANAGDAFWATAKIKPCIIYDCVLIK